MYETKRFGSDPYDSVSANGWYVVLHDVEDGFLAVKGPYCDKRVAERQLDELNVKKYT